MQRGGVMKNIDQLKVNANYITYNPKKDIVIIQFTDARLFRSWLSLDETSKATYLESLRKQLGTPILILPPGMDLRVIRRPSNWHTWWYVLNGQKRTDRLIKKALEVK